MIHLDFESRSEINIWDAGAYTYSKHPSTEILCMAYVSDKHPDTRIITKDFNNPKAFYLDPEETFSAYNSFFEYCMWQNIMVAKYGWPEIPLGRWRDTMAKVCAHALPRSLGNAGKAMHATVQKSDEGRRVMLKVCKPRRPTKSNPKISAELRPELCRYLLCRSSADIDLLNPTLIYGMKIQKIFKFYMIIVLKTLKPNVH